MPIIKLVDGGRKKVKYGQAAELNQYLDEPEKLEKIKDPKERKEKEDFLSKVESIDWSDLATAQQNAAVGSAALSIETTKKRRDKINKIMKNPELKGKQKFDAIRQVLREKES